MPSSRTPRHQSRKTDIVDCAQQFFYTKGYENTTIAMIIDALGIAKGTFYHYFNSKDDLLNEVISRLVVAIESRVERIVGDQEIDAIEKLNRFFIDITEYKGKNKEAVIMTTKVLYSDENIVLRDKLLNEFVKKSEVYLQRVLEQGKNEGVFQIENASCMATLIMYMLIATRNMSVELLLASRVTPRQIDELYNAYICVQKSIERVLATPPGTIKLLSKQHIQVFFT